MCFLYEVHFHPLKWRYAFKFILKHFSIHLCFTMIINKAQRKKFTNIGLYFPQHVFLHGQLYIALSRRMSMSTTKFLILLEQPKCQSVMHKKNIVYKKILYTICSYNMLAPDNTKKKPFTYICSPKFSFGADEEHEL